MTDNRTTELQSLSKLKVAGKLRYWRVTIEIPESELHAICDEIQAEHDKAVAATLGEQPAKSGADALSRRARDMARNIQGNLGRCLYRRRDVAEMDEVSETLMELANELNSRAERTCHNVSTTNNFRCSECDAADLDFDKPSYCHGCGARVVGE